MAREEKRLGISVINLDRLYYGYKKSLTPLYEKYFNHDGNPVLMKNTPIAIFAIDYVNKGKNVIDDIDNHVFIRYEYDRYSDEQTVIDDVHKWNASKRVMDIVDSIRNHGYAKGRYKNPKYMINVYKGFESPFGNDKNGFTIKSRKHRAAACIALGMKEIKVKIFEK